MATFVPVPRSVPEFRSRQDAHHQPSRLEQIVNFRSSIRRSRDSKTNLFNLRSPLSWRKIEFWRERQFGLTVRTGRGGRGRNDTIFRWGESETEEAREEAGNQIHINVLIDCVWAT